MLINNAIIAGLPEACFDQVIMEGLMILIMHENNPHMYTDLGMNMSPMVKADVLVYTLLS